jgi:hypothetical protein
MPIASVSDIATLRRASPTLNFVHVEGFAKPGDGGGGDFFWDSNNPYLLDDNVGIVITSSRSGTGRWRRDGFVRQPSANPSAAFIETVPAEGINVKWFGGIGDGNVDDTSAIQNAIKAAFLISDGLFFLTGNAAQSVVTVVLPSGVYNISGIVNATSGIEIAGRITLLGLGGSSACILQTASTAIPIIRSGMEWCTIQGITFKGGLHHIAMYGQSSLYGGFYSPTTYGNVPSIIKDCFFYYPIGPAIWQDCGPTAVIDNGSNGAPLPQSTISVDTTVNFPPAGEIGIVFPDGSSQAITYTGINAAGTAFTGCSGGIGALATGMLVYLPGLYRTFQPTLRVRTFSLWERIFSGAQAIR